MPNLVERYPLVMVAGAVVGGLILSRWAKGRSSRNSQNYAQQLVLDTNPWLVASANAFDNYQYYAVTNSQTRLVYGVGQEVNLVSTDMLQNALDKQHQEIMQEVGVEINALQQSFDQFVSQGMYNPYEVAMAGAANGQQMAGQQINTD